MIRMVQLQKLVPHNSIGLDTDRDILFDQAATIVLVEPMGYLLNITQQLVSTHCLPRRSQQLFNLWKVDMSISECTLMFPDYLSRQLRAVSTLYLKAQANPDPMGDFREWTDQPAGVELNREALETISDLQKSLSLEVECPG